MKSSLAVSCFPGVSASALTGVGLFTPILMLINAFAMLAGAGGAPRAAISMGKKDNRTAEKILGNCLSLLIIMAVILTFIFFIFAPQMLTLFGASGKTLPYVVAYSRIYILGSIFVLIVMGMNPFITTQGFAKISMLTTVIGAVINIILDPIFIFVLDLSVRGAALATVLSQAVGAVWILRFLTGKKISGYAETLSCPAWHLVFPLSSCSPRKVSSPSVSPPAFQGTVATWQLEQ